MTPEKRNWKRLITDYWQYFPLIISATILGSPFLFTGKVLFWGTTILQFIPWRHYAWSVIRAGDLPLWNPLVGMGAPLLANYQSALLYPPNWILFILDSLAGVEGLAWGQGLLVVLHWCLAGAGMIGLLKWMGVGKLGQAVGGLCFGFSSYLVGRASFLSINAAIAWLPWVILYSSTITKEIIQSKKTNKRSLIILCVILTFQLLAGHAQTTWYTILLVFIWSGFYGYQFSRFQLSEICFRNILGNIARTWVWISAALIAAIMVSAAQLFPTFEYLLQSQRSTAVDSELAMTYSFWPWRLITLFAPGMFGSPATGDYWGYGNYWEDAIYIGLLPILVSLWVLIRGRKVIQSANRLWKKQSFFIFAGIIIVVSITFALGNRTPLYIWLFNNFPTFSMFQAPTRLSIWAVFTLTLLTGLGIEYIRRPVKKALYWTRLSTAGAFAVTLGAFMVWGIFKDVAPTFIRASALMGLFGIFCGAVILTAPKNEDSEGAGANKWRIMWNIAVVVLIGGDLLFSNWGLNPGIDRSVVTRMTKPINDTLIDHRIFIPADVEYALKFDDFMRFDTFAPSVGWDKLDKVLIPNTSMLSLTTSVNNFDPLLPARYSQWMDTLEAEMETGNSEVYASMLNLMGVGIVENINLPSEELVSFRPVNQAQRAKLVDCALPVQNGEQAMDIIQKNQLNIDNEVLLEGLNTGQNNVCLNNGVGVRDAQVAIVAESPNRVTLHINNKLPAWAILAEVWYPGWVAMIDGEKVPIYQANFLFRAVQVDAGEHTLEFIYRPLSFYVGLACSLIGILLMNLLAVIPWKNETIP